mmetsp:Transcript_82130/g.232545  ORF Transcript_82130/g.232545 Transcript_82130/m.232545 type:complete len:178 (-) Transcript_82130:292-825(-)
MGANGGKEAAGPDRRGSAGAGTQEQRRGGDADEPETATHRSRVADTVVPGMGRAVVLKAGVDPVVDIDPMGERDTVAWGAVEYIASEGDESFEITILRWGPSLSSIVLSYELRNVNIHPDSFKGFKRRVTMEQGEMRKTVSIPIQDNPYWNVEEMMFVDLEVYRPTLVIYLARRSWS